MAKDPSKRRASLDAFRGELDDYARATIGETWRKDGRALLITAAAAQASRAIRVSSASDPARDGADDAAAAIALLRSPGPRDRRVTWGLGVLAFAALLAALVLARGVAGNATASTGFLAPFNGIPNIFGPASSSPSPNATAVGPPSSSGTNPTSVVVPPITSASPTSGSRPPGPTLLPTPAPNPKLFTQTITWKSGQPSGAEYLGSYLAAASGGGSGNPVVFTSLTSTVCKPSVLSAFQYNGVGRCEIEATQAGNSRYNAATPSAITITVGQASQAIGFTSSPSNPTYLGNYAVTASAAGGAVTFSADSSSSACSVTPAGAVAFTAAGTCVIDANQAGNADYSAAQMRQQQFSVAQASQTLNFTSTAPACPCAPLQQYTVTATGGGSGNPVTFNIDPSSTALICTISGSTVTLSGGTPGTCIIDAFQAGDQDYSAASEIQQTIAVS
jgi:hypothetical protein